MASKKDLSFLTKSSSDRAEATAREKARREAELQEMLRLRAQDEANNVNWDTGSAPITDLDGWRNAQRNAADEDRKKKMEATQGLHGYRGKDVPEARKKNRDSKVFKQWEGKRREGEEGEYYEDDEEEGREEGENGDAEDEEIRGISVDAAVAELNNKAQNAVVVDETVAKEQNEPKPQEVAEKEQEAETSTEETVESNPVPEEEEEEKKAVDDLVDMMQKAETAPAVEEKETEPPLEPTSEPAQGEPTPKSEPESVQDEITPEHEPEPVQDEPAPEPEPEPTPEPEPVVEEPPVEEEPLPTPPPTYSRTDVKFSFGLIVRSNHPTGKFDENLRDNETLRKCMASTSKILIKEMPSPPAIVEGDETTDYSTFPKAYYDPTLEPTVLSIEEDKKDNNVLERGNKRTLVKASFPVFLIEDSEGEKSKALLKETKSTVFKALRAAVSGGQFLR